MGIFQDWPLATLKGRHWRVHKKLCRFSRWRIAWIYIYLYINSSARPAYSSACHLFDDIWIYWMLYDHLSAHSLVAKLGRWGWFMSMRLTWKKSQNTLEIITKITSKWVPKHRECGQRTWFPTLPLLGTADSGTSRVVPPWRVLGGVEIHTQGTTYHGNAKDIL